MQLAVDSEYNGPNRKLLDLGVHMELGRNLKGEIMLLKFMYDKNTGDFSIKNLFNETIEINNLINNDELISFEFTVKPEEIDPTINHEIE